MKKIVYFLITILIIAIFIGFVSDKELFKSDSNAENYVTKEEYNLLLNKVDSLKSSSSYKELDLFTFNDLETTKEFFDINDNENFNKFYSVYTPCFAEISCVDIDDKDGSFYVVIQNFNIEYLDNQLYLYLDCHCNALMIDGVWHRMILTITYDKDTNFMTGSLDEYEFVSLKFSP